MLCPGGELWVDVEGFEEATATARRARDPGAYRTAIDLYWGAPTADRYEEWAEGGAELRNTRLTLHLELARVYEGSGRIREGHRGAAKGPLGGTNQRTDARWPHAPLRLLLSCGTKPWPNTNGSWKPYQGSWMHTSAQRPSGFVRRLLLAHSRRPSSPPIEESSDTGKHNLPASRTSFVGREHEMMRSTPSGHDGAY